MLTDYHVHLRPDGPGSDAADFFTPENARRYREHAEERRLAATVAADDPDAVATADTERDGVEDLGGAEGEGGALDGDEVDH